MPASRVLLLTRQGCTLCVEAEQIVQQVCEQAQTSAAIVDVDGDDDLRSRYNDHLPVVFVDGQLHSYWFVTAARLAQSLTRTPRPMPEGWRPEVDIAQGVS